MADKVKLAERYGKSEQGNHFLTAVPLSDCICQRGDGYLGEPN